MRVATSVLLAIAVLSSTFDARAARAAEPAHEGPPGLLPLAPLVPRASLTGPESLRCECAPIAASDWHWTDRRILGLEVVGFGVLAGTAGLAFSWFARHDLGEAQSQEMAAAASRRIHDRDLVSGALLGVAGLSAVAGAALVLWPEGHRVSVLVLPNGGALVASGGLL
jgi:hypothetical protein